MSEKNLATIAKREGIDRWLIKGPSLKKDQVSGGAHSDELFAIVGALFLDSDFVDASLFTVYLIDRYSDELESFVNFKSGFQEMVARISGRAAESIRYVVIDYKATAFSKSFTSSLVILGQEICEGTGQNKITIRSCGCSKRFNCCEKASFFGSGREMIRTRNLSQIC